MWPILAQPGALTDQERARLTFVRWSWLHGRRQFSERPDAPRQPSVFACCVGCAARAAKP